MKSAAHIAGHQVAIVSAEPEVYGPWRARVDLRKAVRNSGAAADLKIPDALHSEPAANPVAKELDYVETGLVHLDLVRVGSLFHQVSDPLRAVAEELVEVVDTYRFHHLEDRFGQSIWNTDAILIGGRRKLPDRLIVREHILAVYVNCSGLVPDVDDEWVDGELDVIV